MTRIGSVTIVIIPALHKDRPKLADAELHFTDGPLAGMKLQGFAVWEHRDSGKRLVTFPARKVPINGERKMADLFVPIADGIARDAVRELILAEHHRVITTVP